MTRLLIVDDNEQNRYMLQALLAGHGYEVMLAAGGHEALEQAREHPPDLVITDIFMPAMDGYMLCREWKQNEKLKEIPLVFYTATYTGPKDEELGLSMGAARYILKPQEPEALVGIIEDVIRERNSSRAPAVPQTPMEDSIYFREYNQTIFRKLEEKVAELESAKVDLESEIAERTRAQEALALNAKRIQLLLDLHQLLNAPADSVLDFALDACLSATQSQHGFVGLMNETESVLHMHRWSKEVMGQCAMPDLSLEYAIGSAGLWADCVRKRAPIVFNDYEEPHAGKKGLPGGHVAIRRFAAVPIFEGDRIAAVATVANKPQDYDEQDIRALSTLLHKMWEILSRQKRERERETLEEQYRQAQKMEAVGRLAGGVAHDFNNLLQAIMGYGQILVDQLPEEDERHEFAVEVANAAERAAGLTRQLLAFSRRQVLEMEDLYLNDVIENVSKMLRRVIGEDVQLHFIPGHRLGTVHADRGQMEQVLMNLCVNARDAMPDGGSLTIETENVVFDSEYCETHTWAVPGRHVLLSVTDTGCGMSAETQARIFEPFFTTKEVGKGTGLGLATVYGIIRQHQGMIQLYSEEGKGTTFKIYLPVVERAASNVGAKIASRVTGGSETILVAEDDEMVRRLAVRILESAGYTVLTAVNGRDAIRVFRECDRRIDLVLADAVMPELGGKGVYDVLHHENPGLRFLFSSGYSANVVHMEFVLNEEADLVQKPYSPDTLLRKVREVLDRK